MTPHCCSKSSVKKHPLTAVALLCKSVMNEKNMWNSRSGFRFDNFARCGVKAYCTKIHLSRSKQEDNQCFYETFACPATEEECLDVATFLTKIERQL